MWCFSTLITTVGFQDFEPFEFALLLNAFARLRCRPNQLLLEFAQMFKQVSPTYGAYFPTLVVANYVFCFFSEATTFRVLVAALFRVGTKWPPTHVPSR